MSRIYDSSAITQRRRDQAQAGSFINRIQNPNNPQTSYGPLQGNYDASIMNSVKMGQPKEFYRNSGCVIISNGCPCPPIAANEIVSGPVIRAPGPVRNIQVEYGSVVPQWDPPENITVDDGTIMTYRIIAIPPPSSGAAIQTVSDILTTTYSFATGVLVPGIVYYFEIGAVITSSVSLSSTEGPLSSSSSISAPYVAPESTNSTTAPPESVNSSSEFFPNRILIDVTPYTLFTPTKYILRTYTNDMLTSTSSPTDYSTIYNKIAVNDLSCLNVYTFQVQLLNDSTNQYSSFGAKQSNLPVYPFGPTVLSVSNITSTTAQVNYEDFRTRGFDLLGATCIINSPYDIRYTSLTNTSVTLTHLTPNTPYGSRFITILFSKTINGNVIRSSPSSLFDFTTNPE